MTSEEKRESPGGDTRIVPIPPQPTKVLPPQSTEVLPAPPPEEPADGPIGTQPTRVLEPFRDSAEVAPQPIMAPPGVVPGTEPAVAVPPLPEMPPEPRPDWLPADSPWPLPTNVPEGNLTTTHISRLPWWMDDSQRPSLVPLIILGTILVVIMIIAVAVRSLAQAP